jgi:hypothetical protein
MSEENNPKNGGQQCCEHQQGHSVSITGLSEGEGVSKNKRFSEIMTGNPPQLVSEYFAGYLQGKRMTERLL